MLELGGSGAEEAVLEREGGPGLEDVERERAKRWRSRGREEMSLV